MFDGDDDMVVLHAEFDRVAGDRVKTAVHDLSDRLFRDDAKSGSDRTHEQRMADALVALITQRPESSGTSESEDLENKSSECDGITPQAATLIVSVDYDTLSGQLKNAGLVDGTPHRYRRPPPHRLRRWHHSRHLRRRRPAAVLGQKAASRHRRSKAGLDRPRQAVHRLRHESQRL